MPALARPLPRASRLVVAAALVAALAGGLWLRILVEAWPRLMLGGSLCSARPVAFGHCPACLPALALSVLAAVLAGGALLAARRPR